MSRLSFTRDKIYKTVARQLHGVVPCWICGEHVPYSAATLEHIKPRCEGGNSHAENLAISHELCNNRRHAAESRRDSGAAAVAGTDPEAHSNAH